MQQHTARDYRELFCIGAMTELEKSLYGERDPYAEKARGMHFCTSTTKAGNMLNVRVYPIWGRSERAKAEGIRKGLSEEQQRRHNREKAARRLRLLCEANFGAGDVHVTLTYRGEAPAWQRAGKDVGNFLRAIRRLRRRRGLPEMRYLYVIEEEDGEGAPRRIHVHLLMSGGISREEIEGKWNRGYANADSLQPDAADGLKALAAYLTKTRREKHQRQWSSSTNLIKPKTTVSRTRMSNRRVRQLCSALPPEAAEAVEQVFRGYRLTECRVWTSEWVNGVYVDVWLRRAGKGAAPCARA